MSVTDIRSTQPTPTEVPQLRRATALESQPLRMAKLASGLGIRLGKTRLAMQRGRETAQLAQPLLRQRAALILNTEHALGQARCNQMLEDLSLEVERRQGEYVTTCRQLSVVQHQDEPAAS